MTPLRAVYDSVVFVQALISGRGPASACVERAMTGEVALFLSDPVIAEMSEVPLRPELTSRYRHLTPARVEALVQQVRALAVHIPVPPSVFALPRDPKDEPYIDLAVAARASHIVTWNERHLTYLMRGDTPEGESFRRQFPGLTILPPPAFLTEVDRRRGGT